MTTQERLIDLLTHDIPSRDRRGTLAFSTFSKFFAGAIADHLIENGVTIQEWHAASEPPQEAGEYIVICEGGVRPTTLFYFPMYKKWYEFNNDDFILSVPVAKWMPLPEPPKGVE